MKEQSRLFVYPYRVLCMTTDIEQFLDRTDASDTTRGMEGRSLVVAEGLGAGSLALYKVAQKVRIFQFWEICVLWHLERWVWGFPMVVFQVCVGSPSWRGWLGPPPQLLPPWATHRWRSTVCSASVLRRKWGGAAGSRGGPGPVGRQGILRLGSLSSWPSSDLARRNGPWAGVTAVLLPSPLILALP